MIQGVKGGCWLQTQKTVKTGMWNQRDHSAERKYSTGSCTYAIIMSHKSIVYTEYAVSESESIMKRKYLIILISLLLCEGFERDTVSHRSRMKNMCWRLWQCDIDGVRNGAMRILAVSFCIKLVISCRWNIKSFIEMWYSIIESLLIMSVETIALLSECIW